MHGGEMYGGNAARGTESAKRYSPNGKIVIVIAVESVDDQERKFLMNFKNLSVAAVALTAALASVPVAADTLKFGKAEDAIKYRQNSLFVMSQHFGSLGAMANGRADFNADIAKQNGAVLETLAALPWQGFAEGTQGGKSKPEVWKEKTKFDGHASDFVAQAGTLAAAAKTGDLANLKAAFGPAVQTCKACHDAFRNR